RAEIPRIELDRFLQVRNRLPWTAKAVQQPAAIHMRGGESGIEPDRSRELIECGFGPIPPGKLRLVVVADRILRMLSDIVVQFLRAFRFASLDEPADKTAITMRLIIRGF